MANQGWVFLMTCLGLWGSIARGDERDECAALVSAVAEQSDTAKWEPSNQPTKRFAGHPQVKRIPPELPHFLDGPFVKHGIVMGPGENFEAAFNPLLFAETGADGKKKLYMIFRGEKETNDPDFPRRSLPYLASSEDGRNFKMEREGPLWQPTQWFDEAGGVEDPRYMDLRLMPYVDSRDGKVFDGAIAYTGFDKHTARVGAVFFNHNNLNEFRKKDGPIFNDRDLMRNPLNPHKPGWNKSPAAIQYRDPKTGKTRNILYVGEGNPQHGGIMALDADKPFDWKWPARKQPSIKVRSDHYDQILVESAFAPIIKPLPPELARKTGQKEGIYLFLHGDSNPMGYQVGYRIFSLADPTGEPIYASDGPLLSPELPWEIEGQVGKVVFASGAVEWNGELIVAYGAADKFVGLASAPVKE